MPLSVSVNEKNHHEPLAQGQFTVLQNVAGADGEPLAAVTALMVATVLEMVNSLSAQIRAVRAALSANRPSMVNEIFLVRKTLHHLVKALDVADSRASRSVTRKNRRLCGVPPV